MSIKKAIIPAAGLGTRFLPITKGIPKEMLPIVDKPAIEYIVEECRDSGINEILIIINDGKQCIESYFGSNLKYDELENRTLLKDLDKLIKDVKITYIYQETLDGTGGAIKLCKDFVGDEPFAMLFGDDVIFSDTPCTLQLINAYEKTGKTIVGCQERPDSEAILYGVVEKGKVDGKITEIKSIIEKPNINKLASNLCSLGRFILTKDIFTALDKIEKKGKELIVIDAIDYLAKCDKVYAYEFSGKRYDIGNKEGYIKANIDMAIKIFGDDIKDYIKENV